ncbi:sugar-binding transcriptional regulator [Vibrio nigripulchritudo]|uniref:sugar-binding transcriptional regulator n=1 Tax=Vibrio nigripulchritudo TaxID=28173 RepID=UPI0005FA4EE2|nr:sugar-binding transcriptional regulator [Vibrio nigripulchritudo]KJY80484.1 DNA-binding protein [Vibrio nigripulchritudo]
MPNDTSEFQLMTEIATLYYIESETQEAIASRFDISRMKVGRLLKRAHAEGIVDVRVKHHPALINDLEQNLIEKFGIKRALIAPDYANPDVQRKEVAALVSDYFTSQLEEESVVAVGMGRNVAAVADNVFADKQHACTFVCAIGGSLKAGELINPDHICRRLASKFGGKSQSLYAPAFVQNMTLMEELLKNSTVKQTLDKARRADFALVGIGDMSEDSNMVRMGWFSPQEIAEARLNGTVGDMMGYDFIDIHGKESTTKMQGRVIGLQLDDLLRIPNVIAIASESTKAAGILGALRTGAIDTLATSYANALTVLSLDDAIKKS